MTVLLLLAFAICVAGWAAAMSWFVGYDRGYRDGHRTGSRWGTSRS